MCGLLAWVTALGDDAGSGAGSEAGSGAGSEAGSGADAVAGRVAAAAQVMRHRGPDELGTWTARGPAHTVALGLTRLAIIDIEHSHQPLHWGPPETPERYVLVFNGEIYNYLELRAELAAAHGAVFATDGDTEAIVAAYHYWGVEALPRLRGMFAFALRSEEHTSELQSRGHLVCRLLLEK